MNLKESVNLIHLAQYRELWCSLVNALNVFSGGGRNISLPVKVGLLLASDSVARGHCRMLI
jgi:hypothetical protein